MYNFKNKTNKKQKQITYALYMLIGSYFHKSVCRQQALETTLSLYYRDMSPARQEDLEARMIQRIEKALENLLPTLSALNSEVVISYRDEAYRLEFATGFESVVAVVDRSGKYDISVFSDPFYDREAA